MPKCSHKWESMSRGSKRERCTNCGDVYPCAHACGHYDCIVDTGRTLPEHVTLVVKSKPAIAESTS